MTDFVGRLRTPRLAGAPSSPARGELYYDTGTDTLYWWNGTTWISASGGGGGGADLVYNGEYPTASPYTDGDIVIKDGVPYLCVRPTSSPPVPWATTGGGMSGPPGSKWYSGTGAPSGATGIVGDWYLNDANGDVYEKTGTSAWTLRDNLTGPGYQMNSSLVSDLAIANTETVVCASVLNANDLVAGMSFAFKAFATRVGTNSSAATIRIRVGTTTLTGNIAATNSPVAAAVASAIAIDGLITVRSVGSGGTVMGSLAVQTHLAAVTVTPNIIPSTATVAVNTTVGQRIELTFISGNGSNTYTFRNASIARVS